MEAKILNGSRVKGIFRGRPFIGLVILSRPSGRTGASSPEYVVRLDAPIIIEGRARRYITVSTARIEAYNEFQVVRKN